MSGPEQEGRGERPEQPDVAEVAPLFVESHGTLDLDVDSTRFVEPAPLVLPSDSRDERPLDLDVDSARYLEGARGVETPEARGEPAIPIFDVDSARYPEEARRPTAAQGEPLGPPGPELAEAETHVVRADTGRADETIELGHGARRDPWADAEAWRGRRLGAYELSDPLARGGQGVVFKATHRQLGHQVALKVLDPGADEGARLRFRQEARVLVRLRHPNLTQVFDLGQQQGVEFLAMELLEGEDLETWAARVRPDPRRIARVLEPIARALHYCHGAGVVHRDVKPGNVLVELAGERPVLCDFGLVKRDVHAMSLGSLDLRSISRAGEIKGSPEFMAPEQVDPGKFGPVGPRTDVHGLGATLFSLLTGRAPFVGKDVWAVLDQVLQHPPPRPSELAAGVPPALDALCAAALAKDAAARPESAAAFAEALRAFLEEGRAEPPPAPPAPQPAPRPGQRRTLLLALLVLLLAAVLLTLELARG